MGTAKKALVENFFWLKSKLIKLKSLLGDSIGLTANKIMWIALIFIVLVYFFNFDWLYKLTTFNGDILYLHHVGIALFLFIITESIRHSRCKPKFVLHLYTAIALFALLGSIIEAFPLFKTYDWYIGNPYGPPSRNFMFTLFYTALYIVIIENIINAVRKLRLVPLLLNTGILLLPFFIAKHVDNLLSFLTRCAWNNSGSNIYEGALSFIYKLINDLFVSPLLIQYSFLFVIMGVLMYFTPNKYLKSLILLVFCYVSLEGLFILNLVSTWAIDFFVVRNAYLYQMVYALPFILLYNGQKGRNHNFFFYTFYILWGYVYMFLFRLVYFLF